MYDNLSDIFTLYMIQKKMPTKCSVKNCKYYYGAGETMFKIPVPCPQSWLQAMARNDGENNIKLEKSYIYPFRSILC